MKKQIAALNTPPAMSRGIEVLVESGEYPSESDVLTDAFRVFSENKPEKKTLIGTEPYRRGQVSLMRASEIAGMDFESFKEMLTDRGIRIRTATPRKRSWKNRLVSHAALNPFQCIRDHDACAAECRLALADGGVGCGVLGWCCCFHESPPDWRSHDNSKPQCDPQSLFYFIHYTPIQFP